MLVNVGQSQRASFSKKKMADQNQSGHAKKKVNISFALRDISNAQAEDIPSLGKITISTNAKTARESGDGQGSLQEVKENQLVPGIRFGRFFGTLESATERVIKKRVSREKSCDEGHSEVDTLRSTIKMISNNEEPTHTEQFLIRKLTELNKELAVLEEENPKLEDENRKLKEEGRSLRTTSMVYQRRSDWWEKYVGQKDVEVIRKMNDNFKAQMKMVNAQNTSRVSSRSMLIR